MLGCSVVKAGDIPPPEFKPYTLPTFDGSEPSINDHVEPLIKGPIINADSVFQKVLTCYPHKSKWKIDVELRGAVSTDDILSDTGGTLGRNYVQIVASMPLYSAKEMDRAVNNEHKLRQEIAQAVANFVSAIADRNNEVRQLALYNSLEARASVRVKSGVAPATEQVGYLEKVARAHESIIKAEASIMEYRLSLSAMCSGHNYKEMNIYLKKLAEKPK